MTDAVATFPFSVTRRRVAYPPAIPGSAEWVAQRERVIGASELPALMLPSRTRNPFTLFLSKTGQSTRRDEDPRGVQAGGRYFEASIAQWYCDTEPGPQLSIAPAFVEVDDQCPRLAATPDYDVFEDFHGDRSHILECKLRSGLPQGFGDEGTDQLPDEILLQNHGQLTCVPERIPFVITAVFLGGIGLRVYKVHRDEGISNRIREVVSAFDQQFLTPKKEPALDGYGLDEYISRKFLRSTSEVVRTCASPDEERLLEAYCRADSAFTLAKDAKEHAAALLKNAIGESKGLEGKAGRALWSNVNGRASTDWQTIAQTIAQRANMDSELPTLIQQHTARAEGHRSLRFTAPKEAK